MIQWCTSCLNLPCSFWAHHAWIILYIIVYYLYRCFPETVVRRTVRPTGVLSVRWCEGHAHMTYLHMCRDRTAMQGSFPGTITCARLSWHITQESLFTVHGSSAHQRIKSAPQPPPAGYRYFAVFIRHYWLTWKRSVRQKSLGTPALTHRLSKIISLNLSLSVFTAERQQTKCVLGNVGCLWNPWV